MLKFVCVYSIGVKNRVSNFLPINELLNETGRRYS